MLSHRNRVIFWLRVVHNRSAILMARLVKSNAEAMFFRRLKRKYAIFVCLVESWAHLTSVSTQAVNSIHKIITAAFITDNFNLKTNWSDKSRRFSAHHWINKIRRSREAKSRPAHTFTLNPCSLWRHDLWGCTQSCDNIWLMTFRYKKTGLNLKPTRHFFLASVRNNKHFCHRKASQEHQANNEISGTTKKRTRLIRIEKMRYGAGWLI